METGDSRIKRVITNGDEQDVHTSWRKLYVYLSRPGIAKKLKRATNRRERREAQRWIDEQRNDYD